MKLKSRYSTAQRGIGLLYGLFCGIVEPVGVDGAIHRHLGVQVNLDVVLNCNPINNSLQRFYCIRIDLFYLSIS